jgi:hypothetical protein
MIFNVLSNYYLSLKPCLIFYNLYFNALFNCRREAAESFLYESEVAAGGFVAFALDDIGHVRSEHFDDFFYAGGPDGARKKAVMTVFIGGELDLRIVEMDEFYRFCYHGG